MSSNINESAGTPHAGGATGSAAAEAVRRAFAALPFDQKLSTLLRVELDMVGDIAEAVVSTASRVVDDIGRSFSGSRASSTQTTTTGGPTTSV